MQHPRKQVQNQKGERDEAEDLVSCGEFLGLWVACMSAKMIMNTAT
jgi:hypothetical protein